MNKLIKTALLFFSFLFLISSNTNAFDQDRMLVILTGATKVTDIGDGCKASVSLIKNTFEYIGVQLGMKVDFIELTGMDFTKDNIKSSIAGVPADTYQTIVFFNTSHGFNYLDQQSKFTYFVAHPTKYGEMQEQEFNQYGVSLEFEVLQPLLKKKASNTFVFSESCNLVISANAPQGFNRMSPFISMNVNVKKRLRELFQNANTSFIACSSKYGQASWTDLEDGGIYTNALIHSLNDAIASSYQANWRSILTSTKNYTQKYAVKYGINGGQESIDKIIDTPIKMKDGNGRKNKSNETNNGYITSGIILKRD